MSNEVKKAGPLKPAAATKEAPLPLRQAFTIERVAGGWSFVTVTYTDDCQVKEIVKSQPDIKPIILEKFKIASFKYWTGIG